MYLKNGFFVKNQWFYILPIGLFFLINVNAFFAPEVDLKPLIAQMGVLTFFGDECRDLSYFLFGIVLYSQVYTPATYSQIHHWAKKDRLGAYIL